MAKATERQLIIDRIEQIRKATNNFDISTMKFKSIIIITKAGNMHASKVDFNTLENFRLIPAFEQIIKRYYSNY